MKKMVAGQSPWGLHKSEAKERILLHSQLLLVSCPAGKNRRRTKQDPKKNKVRSEEEQSKVTNTESVFRASQKIDSVEGSTQIQKSQH